MSKRSPGSKHAMRIGKERYKAERERFRAKLARKRELEQGAPNEQEATE